MFVPPVETVQPGSAGPALDSQRPNAADGFQNAFRPSAPSAPAAPSSYTIARGDSLWKVCRTALESAGQPSSPTAVVQAVHRVAQANNIKDPNLIQVGQKLDMSAIASGPAAPVVANAAAEPVVTPPPVQAASAPAPPATPAAALRSASLEKATLLAGSTPPIVPHDVSNLYFGAGGGKPGATSGARDVAKMIDSMFKPKVGPAPIPDIDAVQSPWKAVLAGSGRLTSPYGMRKDPFTGQPEMHHGVDIAATRGTQIFPVNDGEVVFSGWMRGYGRVVRVKHDNGMETVYGHNSANLVRTGDYVTQETPIGKVGSTGRSTGPHLHFEVLRNGKSVDPVPMLTRRSFDVAQSL